MFMYRFLGSSANARVGCTHELRRSDGRKVKVNDKQLRQLRLEKRVTFVKFESSNAKGSIGPLTPHSFWGWEDFRAGRGYRPEYEKWNRVNQGNYENGRLRAANVMAAFRALPPRQDNKLVAGANARIGNAIPSDLQA